MKEVAITRAEKKLSGAAAWNRLASPYTNFMKKLVIHIILRGMVRKWLASLDPDAKVLCLGCGGGIETSEFWEEHQYLPNMTVVDIAKNMLVEHEDLNPNGRIERVCSDSLEYLKSQPDGAFDAVYSLNGALLSNEKYMGEYFHEVYRVLAPGGRLWLSMVREYTPIQLLKAVADVDYGIIWPYPVAAIKALLYVHGHKDELEDAMTFKDYIAGVEIGCEVFLSHNEWQKEICKPGFRITHDDETLAGPRYSKRGKPFSSVFEAMKD